MMKHEITLAELEKSRMKVLMIVAAIISGLVLIVIGSWLFLANINQGIGIIVLIIGIILLLVGIFKVI